MKIQSNGCRSIPDQAIRRFVEILRECFQPGQAAALAINIIVTRFEPSFLFYLVRIVYVTSFN